MLQQQIFILHRNLSEKLHKCWNYCNTNMSILKIVKIVYSKIISSIYSRYPHVYLVSPIGWITEWEYTMPWALSYPVNQYIYWCFSQLHLVDTGKQMVLWPALCLSMIGWLANGWCHVIVKYVDHVAFLQLLNGI